ncbi:MmcQ/YjbR family DNA-binding protein [Saccharopolyspora sp. NPDC002686]|uniref:MmcQ/YjbR family DNA-binding protein n=1 Tax=Saccharopolyspora sp. NPDC002686 TaxID=3154541 RepID=UPI00332B8FD3
MTITWNEDDRLRVRTRLVELVSAFPGVQVDDSHGHTGFLSRGKRFAWLLADHHGDGRLALAVKAPPGEQEALVADNTRYFAPAYLGPRGWVGVNLDEKSAPDWTEIAALLEQAWRMSATKRAIAEYDHPTP